MLFLYRKFINVCKLIFSSFTFYRYTMRQKLKNTLKKIFIHRLKDLGTFLSAVYALFIGSALMFLESHVDFGSLFQINKLETYTRLVGVANILISILIGNPQKVLKEKEFEGKRPILIAAKHKAK